MKLMSKLFAAALVLLTPGFAWAQSIPSRSFPSFAAVEDASPEAAQAYPLQWDPSQLTWKTSLEGYGQSCPLVLGEQVFVSTVVGANKESCKITCLSLKSGDALWERKIESSFPVESTPMVSRAAPTPIGDSMGIYVFFESGDLVAYGLDGRLRWQRSLQKELTAFENKFGLSATPVQTAEHLLLLIDHSGESSVLCLDKATGANVWVVARGKRAHSWSSPAIIKVDGEPVVVCSSIGSIDAYQADTGKLLCSYTKVGGNSVATPYDLGNGRFLVSSLIRPADGPSENATISNMSVRISKHQNAYSLNVEWTAENARGSFCSPVEHAGYCYWINPQGVLYCLDAKTGAELYATRTSAGACWATPFAVGDRLYLFGKEGDVSVVRIGKEFEELARGNRIWEKNGPPASRYTLYAAVPIANGFLFRRGDMLFRVDKGTGLISAGGK